MNTLGKKNNSSQSKFKVNNRALQLIVFIIVFALTFVALEHIRKNFDRDLAKRLNATLEITDEAIRLWAIERIDDVWHMSLRQDLRETVERLLQIVPQKDILQKSSALYDLRGIVSPWLGEHDDQGFFLINPDYINIASMGDDNLGKVNQTVKQGDYLRKLFEGQKQLILPFATEGSLSTSQGSFEKRKSTILVGVPIFDKNKKVIAAFVIRIDSSKDFTRIVELASMDKTDNCYAFDKEGCLLSDARFAEQLSAIAHPGERDHSIRKISLRDPGGDLTQGFKPLKDLESLPFTLPVQRVLLGNTRGQSISAYRDCRGVPVVGSWLWNNEYGFALVYEMEAKQALQNYHVIRLVVVFLFVSIAILFLCLTNTTIKREKQICAANQTLSEEMDQRSAVQLDLERSNMIHNIINSLLHISLQNVSQQEKMEAFIEFVTLPFAELEPRGAIFLFENDRLILTAQKNLDVHLLTQCKEVPLGHCLCGKAAQAKKAVFVNCLDDGHCNTYKGIIPHGHYCVPILDSHGELLGMFTLYTKSGAIYNNRTEGILQSAADIMANIITQQRVHDALKLSKENYQNLVENLKEKYFFYSHNTHGIFTYLSPSVTNILGYSQKEFMNHYSSYLTDNPLNDLVRHYTDLSLQGEKQPPYLVEIKHKNGGKRLLEVSESPVFDKQGNVVSIDGLANDITEAMKISDDLRSSNNLLEKIFETTHFSIVYLDRNFNFVRVNKAYANACGYPADYFIGKNHFDLYPHPENEMIFKRVVASGMSYSVFAKPFEYPDHPEWGTTYWDWTVTPVLNEDASVEILVFALVDVTMAKKNELELQNHRDRLEDLVNERTVALHDSEEQVRLLLNSTAEAIYGMDLNGKCTFCNFACLHVLGYTKQEELLGQDMHRLMHHSKADGSGYPADQCKIHKAFLKGQGAHVKDEVLWRKDGSSLAAEYWSYPIIKKDVVVGGVVTFLDITDRKNREEELFQTIIDLEEATKKAEAATQAKSNFLANMSHEIRTPMNAIIGMTHLALQTELSIQQKDYLNKASESAKYLLDIVNGILDFSKIEAKKLEFEHIDFCLDDVLSEVLNTFSYQVTTKGLELKLDLSPDLPLDYTGDPLRLAQVLKNLVGNALKFTERGVITISAQLISQSLDEICLGFSVQDTGIGLTERQFAALFQPFSQADGSTTRLYGGTGLGLAICKRLVRVMGGEIQVQSKAGEGSTFSFTVNLTARKKNVDDKYSIPPELTGVKILVVDNEELVRRNLQNVLGSFSFSVKTVASGYEAIAALEQSDPGDPYQVLLTSWNIPELDGVETIRRIKANPAIQSLPHFVMMTGYDPDELSDISNELGLSALLVKPITRSKLYNIIMTIFCQTTPSDNGGMQVKCVGEDAAALSGAKILVVEDNIINQEVAREILKNAKANVEIANNGEEAVQAVKEKEFDLVLMDIQMPVMDGYQAAQSIRELEDGRYRHLPILAMTAHALKGDRQKVLAAGMNDHISKPVDPDKLRGKLAHWLRVSGRKAKGVTTYEG